MSKIVQLKKQGEDVYPRTLDSSVLVSGETTLDNYLVDLNQMIDDSELVISTALNDLNARVSDTYTSAETDSLISNFFDGANYDSNTKKIYFTHSGVTKAQIDATDFIKDGMVDNVAISGGNLVITFNTDSGKEAISIPISSIFDASLYYTSAQTDNLLSAKQNTLTAGDGIDITNNVISSTVDVPQSLRIMGLTPSGHTLADDADSYYTDSLEEGEVGAWFITYSDGNILFPPQTETDAQGRVKLSDDWYSTLNYAGATWANVGDILLAYKMTDIFAAFKILTLNEAGETRVGMMSPNDKIKVNQIDYKLPYSTASVNAGNVTDGAYTNVTAGRTNWIDSSAAGAAVSLGNLQFAVDPSGRLYSRNKTLKNGTWNITDQLMTIGGRDVNTIYEPSVVGYGVCPNAPTTNPVTVYTLASADLDGNGYRSLLQIVIDRTTSDQYMRTAFYKPENSDFTSTTWIKITSYADFEDLKDTVEENESVTAYALTNLDTRLTAVESGQTTYTGASGVTVSGSVISLTNSGVTTDKIDDSAVTWEKIDDGAIDYSKFEDNTNHCIPYPLVIRYDSSQQEFYILAEQEAMNHGIFIVHNDLSVSDSLMPDYWDYNDNIFSPNTWSTCLQNGSGCRILLDVGGATTQDGKIRVPITIDKKVNIADTYEDQYLTFEPLESGDTNFTLRIGANVTTTDLEYIEYSTNGGVDWEKIENQNSSEVSETITVEGRKVFWRGSGKQTANQDYYMNTVWTDFTSDKNFKAYGNIMSLLYADKYRGVTTFSGGTSVNFFSLFRGCAKLVDASNLVLPVTALTASCYSLLFYGCSGLTSAPELPAKTLANFCYSSMFQNCTGLTSAPELPATVLAQSCYAGMFNHCNSLTVAPELPATTLANFCYNNMFSNCTSLTTAPELPATTLVSDCYKYMFSGCTNLNYIKAMFTTTPTSAYTNNWVTGVAATGTFVKSDSASWDVVGVHGVPSGWTVYTESGYEPVRRGDNVGGGLTEVTYSALVALRNASGLTPGATYKITDYVTTTTQENTQSAGHIFDVIVKALSNSEIDENARAIQHEGDTYFADSNLNAWEIKYCLDNDNSRFHWADSGNGKGVIYYMKDEYNNECHYDFKNIMFQRWAVSAITGNNVQQDLLDELEGVFVYDSADQPTCYSYWNTNIPTGNATLVVNSAISAYYYTFTWIDEEGLIQDFSIEGNSIASEEGYIDGCYGNSIGKTNEYTLNTSEHSEDSLAFVLNNVVFVSTYTYYGNAATYGTYSNHLGDSCHSNTFGNNANSNTFGNYLNSNTFGNGVYFNTFGNDVNHNTFGNYLNSNTFGNGVYFNTFGNDVNHNTFGNNVLTNTFGSSVGFNTFGNNVRTNTFGSSVGFNTFGNNVQNNTFGSFVKNIIVENGNLYITLSTSGTTDNNNFLQNIKISQGVNNANSESGRKTIVHPTLNDQFQTIYAKDSLGNIIGYNPADVQKVMAEALTDLDERLKNLEQSSVSYQ